MSPSRKKKIVTVAKWFGVLYVGSYLCLSLMGRYEPAVIGSLGVKWYTWAPKGFVTNFRHNPLLAGFYFPLLLTDVHHWHTADKAHSGYPINEVPFEETWRVAEAWRTP